jgi:hypothetical protein
MNEDEKLDITEAVDELPDERKVIALERACKKIGIETLRLPDGTLQIDAQIDDEDLEEAFADELKNMVLDDIMRNLEKDGYVDASVTDDGSIAYQITERGRQALKEEQ